MENRLIGIGKNTASNKNMLSTVSHAVANISRGTKEKCTIGLSAVRRFSGFEQHIAVFGESGSGKTTLLSAFYGKQQSYLFGRENGYQLIATSASQGQQLLANYNGIRDNTIEQTRLEAVRYEFGIRPVLQDKKSKNLLQLVWLDYPGEWLTEDHFGLENERKRKAFEQLVKADVGYFLVDAVKLKEEGSGYLKRLFANFKDNLVRLHDQFEEQGKLPFYYFPRLWYVCLSKADLLPDWNVERFARELTVANDEILDVERVLGTFVRNRNVDFRCGHLLLSSLKMDPDSRKITNWEATVGIDAIIPVSLFTPIFRSYRIAKVKDVTTKSVKVVLKVAGTFFISLSPVLASVGAWIAVTTSTIPFAGWLVGGALAAPLVIASAVASGGGLLLKAAGGAADIIQNKINKSKSAIEKVLYRLQLKIIEARDRGICQIKDLDEYIH